MLPSFPESTRGTAHPQLLHIPQYYGPWALGREISVGSKFYGKYQVDEKREPLYLDSRGSSYSGPVSELTKAVVKDRDPMKQALFVDSHYKMVK